MTIYCKAEANEFGEYADANGTLYSIEWGHHIEAPDGKKNEELGYKPFASLDEAAEAFGLTNAPQQEAMSIATE